jgi:hypothetical protein
MDSTCVPGCIGRATSEASDQPCRNRKRTILFAEHLTNEVLLRLPHRQFVFTQDACASKEPEGFRTAMAKALRPFFRHDRRLFADVSRLIYNTLREFYHEVAGRELLTGMVITHQTFGDMLRWNPHFDAGCRAAQQSGRIATRLDKFGRSPSGFDPNRLKSRGVPERSEERSRH